MMWIFRILGFVFTWLIIYIVGAFIAWDINPVNWWLVNSTIGRIILAFLFFASVKANFINDNL